MFMEPLIWRFLIFWFGKSADMFIQPFDIKISWILIRKISWYAHNTFLYSDSENLLIYLCRPWFSIFWLGKSADIYLCSPWYEDLQDSELENQLTYFYSQWYENFKSVYTAQLLYLMFIGLFKVRTGIFLFHSCLILTGPWGVTIIKNKHG